MYVCVCVTMMMMMMMTMKVKVNDMCGWVESYSSECLPLVDGDDGSSGATAVRKFY